jgi:hypothetical protein
MELSTFIIMVLGVLLYLAVNLLVMFVHALTHALSGGGRREPTGLFKLFLLPSTGILWVISRLGR